jgi:outer membrane protein assembly factor BamB
VTALSAKTGETAWKTDRPPLRAASGDFKKSFSTPLIIRADGRAQAVVPGAQWIVAYDPATGKEIWRVDDGNGFSGAPRPVSGNGMVYVCTGNAGGRPQLWAIRIGGSGDVTSTHVAWKLAAQIPMMASPLLVGDRLFVANEEGMVICVDALGGKILGRRRAAGSICASPVFAEGRIYAFDQEGKGVVLRASEDLDVLGESALPGPLFASPAIAGSALFIRTDGALYRIEAAARKPDGASAR